MTTLPDMSISALVLLLVLAAVFLYALFLVVRAAVREGVQQALRADLLRAEERRTADK